MSLSGIKPITAISGSISFCRKIMQKHQTGRKNTSGFPTMFFFKKRGYFFSEKIINRNRKWNKMAVSYPLLVYNTISSSSRVLENQINFFLSFHLQKQNVKFFNVLLNHLNLELIHLRTGLYQLKTEGIIKNFKKTFLLSITGSKNVNIDKINNTNNITGILQNINRVTEPTDIPEKTCFLKSLLPESRLMRTMSDSRISWIESTIINKIEKTAYIIKNLSLLFTLKFSYNLSSSKVNGYLKNRKLSEKAYLLKKLVLLSRVSTIRSRNTLQVIEALSSRKSLKDQYLLNDADDLNSSIFSTDIDYWSNSSFLSTMYQLRDTFFSKAPSRIYSQNFAEKLLRMDFSAHKKMTKLKIVSSGHYFTLNSKQLKVNIIKNPSLSFTLKSPESLPDQVISELSNSKIFLKNFYILTNNIFLNEQSFLKNIIPLKILNFSAIKNNLYSKSFFNLFNNDGILNRNLFPTGTYHLKNLNFLDLVFQLHNKFFSKIIGFSYPQNFAEKLLRINLFADKKTTELKIVSSSHNFTPNFEQLKVNIIKNSSLSFSLKVPENLPDHVISGLSINKNLLENFSFLTNNIFFNEQSFLKNIIPLKILNLSAIRNNFHRKSSFNQLFNKNDTLNSSFFSTGIYPPNNSNFLDKTLQLHHIFFSKASRRIYSQNFAEKLLGINLFDDKRMTVFEKESNSHSSNQKINLLEENRIKNSILLFTLKLPEGLPDQTDSKLLDSRIFLKSPRYLKDSVFLSNERFLKSIILLKTLNSSAIMNDFYRLYFLNHFFNQDSTSNNSFFSTGIYQQKNPNFLNSVIQLRYKFFSKTSKRISSPNLTEKPLRMDFSADIKIREFKVTDNKRNFAQGSKLLNFQNSKNDLPKFEHMTAFSSHVVDLSLNNLTLSGRKKQFSTLINQKTAIAKKNLIFSVSHFELRNKRLVSIFKTKMMFCASGNEIHSLDYGKNQNFQKNGENLIFRTQSDMERKIEEKIEQKVRKNIEQIKKASTEAIEAIVQQSQSDYSGIRERQKQFLDINSISDQVFRLMEHRLIIERERRGIL